MLNVIDTPDEPITTLTPDERDEIVTDLAEDGFAVLPGRLPAFLHREVLHAIDREAARQREADPGVRSVKAQNCVAMDHAFVELMMWEPALQLSHDVLGPVFQLNQSNFQSRLHEPGAVNDFVAATGWHADGPRPAQFPKVPGPHGPAMGLHYLKFGYFLTDMTSGACGSLQVVRGSHLRPELDGKGSAAFDINDYDEDVIQLDCPAGSVVCFHQAQWHAAPGVADPHAERKNVYISYCPTWMRPLDYEFPREGEAPNGIEGLSDEAAFLLGRYRPALRFWLPSPEDRQVLRRFGR